MLYVKTTRKCKNPGGSLYCGRDKYSLVVGIFVVSWTVGNNGISHFGWRTTNEYGRHGKLR